MVAQLASRTTSPLLLRRLRFLARSLRASRAVTEVTARFLLASAHTAARRAVADAGQALLAAAADPRAEHGYIHAGPAGSGHFVKMIHNGIEYGMMQAFAEGFDILKTKNSENLPEDQRFDLNVADIAEVWRRGSVVSSWLLDLTADALATDPKLDGYSGSVADSGEGRWTIEAAMEQAVPVPVLSTSLFARFRSRQQSTYGDKMLSAMRFGFGGHVETSKK